MKLTDNFELHEFINPTTYNKFGVNSLRYIRPEIIAIAQLFREIVGCPVTINNWKSGGSYSESGLRDFNTSTGASYSAHKFGAAIDVKTGLTSHQMAAIVEKNWGAFKVVGLTRIEDPDYTEGKSKDWLHMDCLWTGKNELVIVRP